MENLIKLHEVGKRYGNRVLLENINVDINKGDAITFIGHNGTGKSTLLKMIGNLVSCDTGSIDYIPNIKIAYVPEHFPKLNITALRYISSMAQILGMDKKEAKERSEELFELFFMSNMVDTPIKYLSKGSQQKVAVIQALLTNADVLLLDEPLSGQDSDSQKQFIQMVKELNRKGTAIVMSCHERWLMNALTRDIYEIEDMTLVKKSKTDSLLQEYTVMTFEKGENVGTSRIKDVSVLQDLDIKVEERQGTIVVSAKRENSTEVLLHMLQAGYELRRMDDETME